jgi:uncharacterized protein YodC (DUF2158 family)
MMADKVQWKAGDKVKLLSGGPAMTVQGQKALKPDEGESVLCVWFDDNKARHQGVFVPEALEVAR